MFQVRSWKPPKADSCTECFGREGNTQGRRWAQDREGTRSDGVGRKEVFREEMGPGQGGHQVYLAKKGEVSFRSDYSIFIVLIHFSIYGQISEWPDGRNYPGRKWAQAREGTRSELKTKSGKNSGHSDNANSKSSANICVNFCWWVSHFIIYSFVAVSN